VEIASRTSKRRAQVLGCPDGAASGPSLVYKHARKTRTLTDQGPACSACLDAVSTTDVTIRASGAAIAHQHSGRRKRTDRE